MFRIYRWLFNLVGFSRSQSNGFLILMPLMLLVLFSHPIYEALKPASYRSAAADERMLDSVLALFPVRDTLSHQVKPRPKVGASPRRSFRFNPNTASKTELLELGFEPHVANRLINYRGKGGKFKTADDILKIMGMDSAFFYTIQHLVAIPAAATNNVVALEAFDLNKADTVTLKKIKGIGVKLSARIVKYRDALGGFVSTQQIFEVYNLDSTVARQLSMRCFVAADFKPNQYNINTSSMNSLATHPYISTRAARSIVTHRLKHGFFKSLDELRQVTDFDTVTLRKLTPYLKVSD